MYFALSTTLAFFSAPTNVFLGLALLGLVLVWLAIAVVPHLDGLALPG